MARDAVGVPIKPMHVQKSCARFGLTRWIAALQHKGSYVSFGSWISRADAARAADRALIVLYGDCAALNVPGGITDEEKEDLQAVSDITAYACKCRALAKKQSAQQLLDGAIRDRVPQTYLLHCACSISLDFPQWPVPVTF
jgi:hypothetical protein